MKKTTLFLACALMIGAASYGQARKELNFGLIGANYEIPVHKDITVAPGLGTDFSLDWLTIGVRGNYYFDDVFDITDDAWDVYGGANVGYSIYTGDEEDDSDFNIGLQVGGRWFWNDKWGIYLELGGGIADGMMGSVGLTVKL